MAIDRRPVWMRWNGLVRDDRRDGYVETATGRFIGSEAMDAYAREKLNESVERFSKAWAGMMVRPLPPLSKDK